MAALSIKNTPRQMNHITSPNVDYKKNYIYYKEAFDLISSETSSLSRSRYSSASRPIRTASGTSEISLSITTATSNRICYINDVYFKDNDEA